MYCKYICNLTKTIIHNYEYFFTYQLFVFVSTHQERKKERKGKDRKGKDDTDRQTDRQTQTDTDRHRQRQTDRQKERKKVQKYTMKDKHITIDSYKIYS